jgi:hypothetical protein
VLGTLLPLCLSKLGVVFFFEGEEEEGKVEVQVCKRKVKVLVESV